MVLDRLYAVEISVTWLPLERGQNRRPLEGLGLRETLDGIAQSLARS